MKENQSIEGPGQNLPRVPLKTANLIRTKEIWQFFPALTYDEGPFLPQSAPVTAGHNAISLKNRRIYQSPPLVQLLQFINKIKGLEKRHRT